MDMRIQTNPCGNNAGSDIRAALDVDAAICAKSSILPRGAEIQVSDPIRSKGVSKHRVEQPHIKIAQDFGLPARMRKILQ